MLKKWVREYIQINKRDILLVISLILLGIIMGIGLYIFSPEDTRNLAISSVREVFNISKSNTYVKTNIIMNGIKVNMILMMALAIFSVTLFGKWLIYAIMLLKGAALSIYTILLFKVFGVLWGTIVVFLLVILVNMLYIPAFIYIVVNFLGLNFTIFKTRQNNLIEIYKIFLSMIFSFAIMFSSIIVEQVVSGIVLNIYSKI